MSETEIVLHALSSDGETKYPVTFFHESDERLSAKCSCQAGVFGRFCRHVSGLLAGDRKTLADESEAEEQDLVVEWAKAAGIHGKLADLLDLERESERLKRRIAKLKKDVSAELSGV